MIRHATFRDVPRLSALLAEQHQASAYAGRATFDPDRARSVLTQTLQRAPRFACLFVAEAAGQPEGFIAGIVDRLYGISAEPVAQDLFFIASGRADPRDAGRLVEAYTGWAATIPGLIEAQIGVSMGDWQRVGKLLGRKGYHQAGGLYVQRVVK